MSRTFRGSHSLFAMTILFLLATAMTACGLPSECGIQQRAVTDSLSADDFVTEAFGPEKTGTGAGDGPSETESSVTRTSTSTSTSTGTDEESTSLPTTSEISSTSRISTSLSTTSSESSTTPLTTSSSSASTSIEPTLTPEETPTPTPVSTRRRTSTIPPVSSFTPVPATTLVIDPVITTSVSTTHATNSSATPLGASSSNNDGFWENKPAVGGTFGAVGVVAVGVLGVIVFGLLRKHRSRSASIRETHDWSEKPAYPHHHSPSNSIEDMVSQAPMDAFRQTRDPFQTLNDGALAYHSQPWVNDPERAPSVYSQNLAGYGTVAIYPSPIPHQQYAPDQRAYTPSPAASTSDLGDGQYLAPPVSHSRPRPSVNSQYSQYTTDSFYGAYGSQPAGQAI